MLETPPQERPRPAANGEAADVDIDLKQVIAVKPEDTAGATSPAGEIKGVLIALPSRDRWMMF